VPADEGWWRRCGRLVGFGRRGRLLQQLSGERQVVFSPGVGQQSVVPDSVETAGQHVQQEAAHELGRLQRHRLVARSSLLAVVLPLERDAALVEGEEPVIGDSDAVGVAGQVFQDGLGPGERALGVDHPLDLAQRRKPLGKAA